ncbi:MAG: alpha/beta hydrolase [Propioniciclava sp.]|uniref:alpha/beta hydrolase n=1 Tax=Propioniciclava sp. TaxID=2038686 RepID=UPI0039E4D140
MNSVRKRPQAWLVGALILMLIGMIGASVIQTSGGRVTVKDLKWETSPGLKMSGLLFVPDGVSAESKVPAVVVSHGMYNNREMQDLNFVELSRRGFVVLSMDMYSHGYSDNVTNTTEIVTGMYQAAKMLAGLDYVDATRIGITGHSLGGMSSNAAVAMDNAAGTRYIAAVLLNSADATYVDSKTKVWTDIYGSRDAGIVAGQYDEWFFTQTDANGNKTAPRDFLKNSNAQSFLHFGVDPAGKDARVAETVYTQTVDGAEAMRVIYNPSIIHPWSHFSAQSTHATIEFFEQALGAPSPLPGGDQVWQGKVAFNTLGLIGFGIFLVAFTKTMLRTRFFGSLRAPEPVAIRTTDRAGKVWLWATLVLGAAFSVAVYLPLLTAAHGHITKAEGIAQTSPFGIGVWAATNAAFTLVVLGVFYAAYMNRRGLGLAERGLAMPWPQAGKTVLLAVLVVAAAYTTVFVADYFFKTDFRIWVVPVKAFSANIVWGSLLPMLLIGSFYVVASIAANAINFVKVTNDANEREGLNTTILAVFATLPAVILLLAQYVPFVNTGHLPLPNMYIVWLFPLLVFLPVSTVISRKIYRVTNNPYLGGLINGLVITLIACSNTLTWAIG